MTTATLTSKGQVTIPAAVRASLGLTMGDRVEFIELAPGRYEIVAATLHVTALRGMVRPMKRSISVREMNAAIRARAIRDEGQ